MSWLAHSVYSHVNGSMHQVTARCSGFTVSTKQVWFAVFHHSYSFVCPDARMSPMDWNCSFPHTNQPSTSAPSLVPALAGGLWTASPSVPYLSEAGGCRPQSQFLRWPEFLIACLFWPEALLIWHDSFRVSGLLSISSQADSCPCLLLLQPSFPVCSTFPLPLNMNLPFWQPCFLFGVCPGWETKSPSL